METIFFDKDLTVFYIPATSFPDGIMAAHEAIHKLAPASTRRKFFGISRPEHGVIHYKAAAEELQPGEGKALHCATLVLKTGNYYHVTVKDYTKNIQAIDSAFKQILEQPGLDPNGYCVEWYLNEHDVMCLVRLAED